MTFTRSRAFATGNGGYGKTEPIAVGHALERSLAELGERVKAQAGANTREPAKLPGNFQAAKEGWLKAVAAHPNLSGADYAVAITIATHLNSKKREAWPSLETIAELTNRDRSTVWRSVQRLQGLKLLAIRSGGGRKISNRYSPLFGDMDRDPKTLRRRNKNSASSQ